MALKDWRVYSKGMGGIGYKHLKKKEIIDVIHLSKRRGDHTNLNLVNIYVDGRLEFEKETKTKKQAMKHAKAYMRKN